MVPVTPYSRIAPATPATAERRTFGRLKTHLWRGALFPIRSHATPFHLSRSAYSINICTLGTMALARGWLVIPNSETRDGRR